MILVRLVMLTLLGAGPEADADSLVLQLGSARYAQREAAAEALEDQGRRALPALRQARAARDPEVRARAAALIDRIESGLLVRPTLVRLDYRDRPLAEVVEDLAEQSHIPIGLFPENNPLWPTRRVTLQESEPVPFWRALDLLGQQARVQPMPAMRAGGRGPMLNLMAGGGGVLPPTSHSGPFRIQLQGLNHDRHRSFTASQAPAVFNGQGVALPATDAADDGPGHVTDNFYLTLQLVVEPRMTLATQGAVKLTEAADDRGQSLLPPAASATPLRHSGFNGYTSGGQTSLALVCPLRFPERPGTTIKRLRGAVPLVVSARKDDPTVIPLADAKGKSFKAGDLTLVINDVRPGAFNPVDPANHRETILDLTFRHSLVQPDNGLGRAVINDLALHAPGAGQSRFEIVDAQGKPHTQWTTTSQQFGPEESRLVLGLRHQPGQGPPAQILVYDMMRTTTEATFEFQEIPMP